MSNEEIHGKLVFQNERFVVRVKEKKEGLQVTIHRRKNDKEFLPLGYMLGDNMALILHEEVRKQNK